MMKMYQADIAVSVNWKTKVTKSILENIPMGTVNAHAGDLPRYRGNASIAWAMLAGEKKIVLTLHRMDSEIDEGPVFLKKILPINDQTYIGDVYARLTTVIPAAYLELLDGLRRGTIRPHPQSTDPTRAIRCYPRQPEDGRIDWNSSARSISRLIRSSGEPFDGAYTYLSGKKMIIWRGREELSPTPFLGVPGQVAEIRKKTGEVAVLAKDGFIILEKVQPAGGKSQRPAECILSTRLRL
jgi:UDP-4-amino-4-deoxy-L-arabinose formyltransferase/UDP-glucuronic acid dehydrogenase (UDP-4-keto-hexauronic acid decarboxylating)